MSVEKYSLAMRVLHWLMAVTIISLLAVGVYMEGLADDAPNKYLIYGLHKSFGVIAIVLIAIRIIVRLRSAVPALPSSLAPLEKLAAHWGHKALYLLMLLVPISGFVMSSAHPERYGVSVFGLKLPDLPASEFWAGLGHELHGTAAWVLVAVVVLHIAGALKHRYFDKGDADVLPRMLRG